MKLKVVKYKNYGCMMESEEKETRIPLFVKKKNIEGDDFYYMGDLVSDPKKFIQTTIKDKKNENKVNVVKMIFYLKRHVERDMYEYITKDNI